MDLQQSINRGFNLLATSIVALAGFAFLPEVFLENDIPDKVDDSLLFVLAMLAIGWYARGGNKYMRSVVPLVVVGIALLIKIMGVGIEFGDVESVGDDFGGLILFVCATALVVYQYLKTRKLLAQH